MLNKIIEKVTAYDVSVINWLIKHRDRRVRKAFHIVTYFGSGYFWIFAYLFLFATGTDNIKDILIFVILSELSGLLIIILFRNLIKRERPKADITSLLPWQNNSFPSHHALRVSMLATIFGTFYPSWLPFLIFGASLVSISRIYLERHYPSDVLAGLLTGFLCARFVLFVF